MRPTQRIPKPAYPPTNREMFALLDADLLLANQLFRYGLSCRVLEGVTVPAQRRERIRGEILAHRLAGEPLLGQPRGAAPETLAQAFERLYREPLSPTNHHEGDRTC